MNNRIKQILIILFFFFLLLNIFIFDSLAASTIKITCSNGYSENVPGLPENPYKDYLIYFFGENSVYLYQFNFDENNPPRFNINADGVYKSFFLTNVERNYYLLGNNGWELRSSGTTTYGNTISTNFKGFYSTCNVYKTGSGEILNPQFNNPSFITSKEELETGNFDTLKIDAGDFDFYDDKFILNVYDGVYISGGTYDYVLSKSFLLDKDSSFQHIADLQVKYYIPEARLGIDISNGKHYMFELKELGGSTVYSSVTFTIGGLTAEEEIKKAEDKQTEAIKEQTETNKGIWETIKDILSYINPFSENFFVYKLLELLGDMLKALFVPSEEFMSQWFTDISDYFEDAFGILYYPIDLVIQVLGRFSNISDQEPVISFGSLSLFGHVILQPYSYNFNSLLTNNVLKNLHDFYLIVIDVILWFGLLVYCKNVVANIFGGKFTDDVIDDIQDNDYARYSNYQANKQRYKQEHGGGRK